MKTRIIRLGKARGIRIPKQLLDETGLNGEVEISIRNGSLIITAAHNAREGWANAFREMAKLGHDALLDPPTATRWDEDKWEWR